MQSTFFGVPIARALPQAKAEKEPLSGAVAGGTASYTVVSDNAIGVDKTTVQEDD